jgi:translation initiation factor eIF-2B subunit gamma
MPHAVSMPHSGFQALILCGPGIGLNTFTSVPSEFPKALVEVANRPMVWYVLDWCYRMGVTDITLITPPSSKQIIAAALAQNPHLTSLPSPSPDLLAPEDLNHTTPTAELLSLREVQDVIKSDFVLLPCDLICDIPGETFLERYFISLGGLGGADGSVSEYEAQTSSMNNLRREQSGRRGGLSIWYNTSSREESVKGEECDFMCTAKLDSENTSPLPTLKSEMPTCHMRKLVWTTPMSELKPMSKPKDQVEADKPWKIRQSLLRKHGNVKCLTKYRDSHIYFFPHWVKDFARHNENFESVSEDLVGTWAKAEWRKPAFRSRLGVQQVFPSKTPSAQDGMPARNNIEDEIDLLSLSSTQVTRHSTPPRANATQKRTAQLASRVQADPEDSILSADSDNPMNDAAETAIPTMPPILAYILPSAPTAPLVRRVDTTPLLLSVSLLLAKTPSIEESSNAKTLPSPFAHIAKVAPTATIAPRVTISRSDSLIGENSTIATQCVVKTSVIGANVSLGTGCRITGSVIMDGATIGDKCVITGTVVGKKVRIGKSSTLVNCEVQDANMLGDGVEGKGEKYLVGGLEDDVDDDEFDDGGEGLMDDDVVQAARSEGLSLS